MDVDDRATRAERRRSLAARLVVAAVLMAAMAACGGGDDDVAGGAASSDEAGSPEEAAAGGDASGGGGGGGPGEFGCAITAEQVGEVRRGCTEEVAGQLGYGDPVQVAGEDAWLQAGGMVDAQMLVCSDASFEVQVDTVDDDGAAVASAEALAQVALGSE